ncbi:MAG: hypothetical protein EOP64_00360 [Sphingomonas sp.]|nr:MAG: hypothetical protein EOP64_00360 [Sphingomonas sp.]
MLSTCAALIWTLAALPPFALSDACYFWGPPRGEPGISMHLRIASRDGGQPADDDNSVWELCLVSGRDDGRVIIDNGFYEASPAMYVMPEVGHRQAFYITEGPALDARPLGVSIKLPRRTGWIMRATLKYQSDGRVFTRDYVVRQCPQRGRVHAEDAR